MRARCIPLYAAAIAFLSSASTASSAGIDSWAALQAALDAGGDVALTQDLAAADTDVGLTVRGNVVLDLAGHDITGNGKAAVISIGNGGDLTLTNSIPASGAITGGDLGVSVCGGAFTMNGGTISGNINGGVFAACDDETGVGGSVTMNGGAIVGNFAVRGGGVRVFDSEFTMNGGVISCNAATEFGGGVMIHGCGSLAMNGGKISGNSARAGGGVCATGGDFNGHAFLVGVFAMSGGDLSGNCAEEAGGGVFLDWGGAMIVRGAPVVSGNTNSVGAASNVHLNQTWIEIQGLSAGASIGVTTATKPTSQDSATFTDLASAADAAYFFSDNPAYSVDTDEYGELCLVLSDPVAEPTPVATTWDFVASEGWTAIEDAFTGETNALGRTWTLAGCRVDPAGEAGGDTGCLSLQSPGSAAVAPAFRGVVTQVTTLFRPVTAGSTREVSLLASVDGGATFSVVTNVAVPVRQNYENTFVFDVPLDGGDLGVVFCASNSGAAGTVQLRRLTIEGTSTAPEEPGLHDWSPFGSAAAEQPRGALSGVVLFLDPGLGYAADPATNAWTTGAGPGHDGVADFGNLDQMNLFALQAWKAGATVVPMRPLGYRREEIVIDNADTASRVVFGGAWADAAADRHYGPAGGVGYRWTYACPTGTTAWASYRPDIPVAGEYPVYAWAPAGADRVPQLYRVRHAGGVTDVRVDHRRVGDGWVWLGSFRFAEGTAGCVNVSNYAPGFEGGIVVADAVRFGNGTGDIARGAAGVSGLERELEAARYWIERQALDSQGIPASVYDGAGADRDDDALAPARMAARMSPAGDAPPGSRLLVSFAPASPEPPDLPVFRFPAPPASFENSLRGREALARDALADAVRRLAADSGGAPAFETLPPDAPVAVAARNDGSGRAVFSWRMPPAADRVSDPHTGFVVYASTDGYAFGNPVAVASAADEGSHTFDGLPAGEPYFFRVCAVNAGGESLPSPVAGVGLSFDGSAATVLLVDGFHRADAGLTPVRRYDRVAGADGPVDVPLVRPRMINSFDYVKEHGNAIAAAGRSFDSVDSALVTAADLAGHPFAVWFVGREGVETETLSYDEQRLIATFLDNRGFLFLSGSDIGRDLGSLGTASDRAFLEDRLRCTFVADDGETGIVGGQTGSFLAGVAVEFNYTNALDDIYAAGRAEVFAPCDVGFSAARYGGADGAETAIVAQQNTQATHPTQPRTILAGFPFETITDEHQRNSLMKKILDLFDASQKDPSWIGDTAYTTGVGGTVEIAIKAQVEGWPSAAVTLAGSFDSNTGDEVDASRYTVTADRFVFTAPADGIYTFTFSAENAAGIIEQDVTVTAGNAPVWQRSDDVLLDLGAATAVYLRALVSGAPAPAIALDPDRTAADPAAYAFDPATGILSLGPSDAPATNAFVFVATNEAGTDALAITNVIRRLDTDGDGIPDWWATEHFGGPTGCPNPNADSDGDRFDNLEEYRRLTDPLDRYSQPLPAYLGGAAPAVVTNYVDWACLHGPDLPGLHLPAFLLNVPPAATPAELRIDGIEVGAEGATIRASATAGGAAVDLTKINGILAVEAGDTVTNLVPKAVRGATFSADGTTATIPVPSSDGFFLRARIGTSAP